MEARLSRELTILPSVCDREMKLSIPDLFAQFMDVATLHAERLGVGAQAMMAKVLFWLTVKERVRAIREYRLEKDGELLAEGKTEWAVIEIASGKLCPMAAIFPPELELATESAYPAPFARISPDFSGAETLGSCTVRSTDIDLGGHMNNIAYLRAAFGVLPAEELKAMPQGGVEIIFRSPCFEGEELTLARRLTDTGWELAVLKQNGTPAAFLKLDR